MAKVSLRHIYKTYTDDKGREVNAVSDVNIEVADREFLVLVGPSGCGKSTTLRMIAGLEEISKGEISIGERVVNDVAAQGPRHRHGLPKLRALSPHERLRQHGFRAQAAEVSQGRDQEARHRGGGHPGHRNPTWTASPRQLSGGQRQRVALGRAIVRQPKVFLFDEPLSNLDAKMRVQTRTELIKLHQRLQATMIYVTHDQVEAMTMGTRIVVMQGGVHPADRAAAQTLPRAAVTFSSPGSWAVRR